MIPPLVIKDRIEEIAAETGEPIGAIVEDGVCYLTERVSLRHYMGGFLAQTDELEMKVCPVNEINSIWGILSASRVDRRDRDRQKREVAGAREARKRDAERNKYAALEALVEDIRNANRGRVITSG
ncbi:MAG: hypothetical protein VW405_01655 [Rhodospirillaceae bacterium]